MKLHEHLEQLEPLRIAGEPPADRPISPVLLARDLPRLPKWLIDHAHLKIPRIIIADLEGNPEISFRLPEALGKPVFRTGWRHLADFRECEPVFLFMPEWPLRIASMGVPGLSARKIYISASDDSQLAPRAPIPDYLARNASALEKVYGALATQNDREVFARRIKSLVTGDAGFLPVAPFLEYEHPSTMPKKGDIVLDGGLSDMVGAQKSLAEKIGPAGIAHGFEPVAWMAEKAAQELRSYSQYKVHALGLADKKGAARFASLRDSSHLSERDGPDTVECQLDTIDNFCAETRLPRVDVIKLDVEGAELAALRGGERTIARHSPRLIVCLYHKPRDLYEIPLWLMEKFPACKMHLAHSSCGFTDTILYARPDGQG